jgi:hypothetical protein
MAENNILHHEEVPNSLGEETAWGDHEALVVTVGRKCRYNSIPVEGVITIHQPDEEALNDWRDSKDIDYLLSASNIQTTAKGARVLAAALIKAADAAERAPS